jgi:hypothetical protein
VAAESLGDVLQLDMGHLQSLMPSEAAALSKKCACAGSILAKTLVAGLLDEPGRVRARSVWLPTLRSTMSIGAERLDDVGLAGRYPGCSSRDEHAFRAGRRATAVRLLPLAFRRRACLSSSSGKSKSSPPRRRPGLARRPDRRIGDVHDRAADELRHEQVGRMRVDVGGRAHLLQHAFVHDDDAVGEAHRLDLVVGDVDRGRALLEMQPLDLGAHLLAQLGVERADRLVHQHRLGPATSARPIATRCMSPPDSAEGFLSSRW